MINVLLTKFYIFVATIGHKCLEWILNQKCLQNGVFCIFFSSYEAKKGTTMYLSENLAHTNCRSPDFQFQPVKPKSRETLYLGCWSVGCSFGCTLCLGQEQTPLRLCNLLDWTALDLTGTFLTPW